MFPPQGDSSPESGGLTTSFPAQGVGPTVLSSEADSKLVHRWVLNDVASGTVVDSIGSNDGTVNGVSSLSGDFAGGSAGDGDGVDDFINTTWTPTANFLTSDFAIAFSIADISNTGRFFDSLEGESNDNNGITVALDTSFSAANSGGVYFMLRGTSSSGDFSTLESSTDLQNSTGPFRVVWNKKTNDVSNWEMWLNQTQENANIRRSDFSPSTMVDFLQPLYMFATHSNGSGVSHTDCTLDDMCVFGDSLTPTEIKSYEDPF